MSTNSSNKSNPAYSAHSIKVIEGLEAVRKRPAMYIGSTGPQGLHHLVYEIVDNSVDEALEGYCDTINVILNTDGSCSVEDNGRGIPTGIHPTEGVSAAEVVVTKLHAGGKFDKESYKFSGGLHGVGVSVVNALSEWFELEIFQNGEIFKQKYERGKPLEPLKAVGTTSKRGTIVRFKPDPLIFQETTDFSFDTLSARMRELAFLNKGLRITIFDERSNKSHEFYFEGGIVSFIEHINAKKTPLFPDVIYCQRSNDQNILEFALQYNDGFGEQLFSFVNNINTVEGGTHVTGFKTALTRACNKRALEFGIVKQGDSFSSEDVREGIVCVINMKVTEPQFEGQTKNKLGNSDVKGLVESWTFACLESFFEENPAIARKILQKAELALHAREAAKKARELTRRKTVLESTILPGKLADCSNENPKEAELFIVEGDSAGGSAKQGRDRHSQAILPLKGKILNVEKARFDKILSNDEIKALIAAIGCGINKEEFAIDKARYHKIILMTDADVDGAHIRTLLLTFFFRYMTPLIEKGYLYIAQPPLYKAKIGKKEQYLKNESEFSKFLVDWVREYALLIIENKPLDEQKWHALLDHLAKFELLLEDVAHKFKITTEHCYALTRFIQKNAVKEVDKPELIIEKLQQAFPEHTVTLMKHPEEHLLQIMQPHLTFIQFQKMNRSWQISLDFFIAHEVQTLLQQAIALEILHQPWTLKVTEKEREISGEGIFKLIRALTNISKPYLQVQRYKGLGEMNADQLWETSMDAQKRTLLQVTIGDALEADSWFDTLMGDDVTGRRTFIEENGHFVKNLDV
ncbi:MAG: DNA topoisomerase (ATP-hydrolyzing) subunit B [Candidatus Babeliaceae bacterium]